MTGRPQRRLRNLLAAGALAGVLAGCAHAPVQSDLLAIGNTADAGRAPLSSSALSKPKISLATDVDVAPATLEALQAFRRACPQILKRRDVSGLTQPEDWRPACSDSQTDPELFFQQHFTALRLGDGRGLATGYFEPELAASHDRIPGALPILGRPPQLVDIDLARWNLAGGRIAGLWQGQQLVPVPDRQAIENGALAATAPVIAWTRDRIGLFFLHIQGSGLLRLEDGTSMRIGYAGNNGHSYRAIGPLLQARGQLQKAGMAEIRAWLQQNPAEGVRVMQENPRYIFMYSLPTDVDGPIGALGVQLVPRANIAIDPRYVPLGAPVAIATRVNDQPFRTFAIAADTGSAIEGANRIDIFFGHGAQAAQAAGDLASPLQAVLYLPKAAAERIQP